MVPGFQLKLNITPKIFQRLLPGILLLLVDEFTCIFYSLIKASLRKKGKPIPENDIWIAAIALQYKFTLVSRDNHFKEVDDLVIEEW